MAVAWVSALEAPNAEAKPKMTTSAETRRRSRRRSGAFAPALLLEVPPSDLSPPCRPEEDRTNLRRVAVAESRIPEPPRPGNCAARQLRSTEQEKRATH